MTFYDSNASRSNGCLTNGVDFTSANENGGKKSSTAELAAKDEMFADDLLHAYEDR